MSRPELTTLTSGLSNHPELAKFIAMLDSGDQIFVADGKTEDNSPYVVITSENTKTGYCFTKQREGYSFRAIES